MNIRRNAFATLSLASLFMTASLAPAQYAFDDGTVETSIGTNNAATITWANEFTAVEGATVIDTIDVAFGHVLNGTSVKIKLYKDGNNDGNPMGDAILVSSLDGVTANRNSNVFNVFDIPDVVLNPGDRFYAAVTAFSPAGQFPAAIDLDNPKNRRSWFAISDDLAFSGVSLIDNVGFAGDWLIRASVAPVPEPATLLAFALGATGLAARRRKK